MKLVQFNDALGQNAIDSIEGMSMMSGIILACILTSYYSAGKGRPAATIAHLIATIELADGPRLRYMVEEGLMGTKPLRIHSPDLVEHIREALFDPNSLTTIKKMFQKLVADYPIDERPREVVREYLAKLPGSY